MKKTMILRIASMVVVSMMLTVSACFRYDPESDFIAEPLDGGKSVRIVGYTGTKWEIRIPPKIRKLPVTIIGTEAFMDRNLTAVTIPESVGEIEEEAFANNQLSTITIPESVTFIWPGAFANNQLSTVILPNSIGYIGDEAFANNRLSAVILPNSIIGYLSGFNDNQLSSITIPSGVGAIGYSAFANNQLTDVNIPNSVTKIYDNAFINNQLIDITIPDSVTEFGEDIFSGNLFAKDFEFDISDNGIIITKYNGTSNDVKVPEEIIGLPVTAIGVEAFAGEWKRFGWEWGPTGTLTNVIIPDSVTSIGYRAFAYNQLTSITISNSVSSLDSEVFIHNQLANVIIPDSISSIEENTFDSNPLTSITIGANVSIPSGAFWSTTDGNYGYGNNFGSSYNNNGKQAGTYTRPYANKDNRRWTKQ